MPRTDPLRLAIGVAMTIAFLIIGALMIHAGRRVLAVEQRYAAYRPVPARVLTTGLASQGSTVGGGELHVVPRVTFAYTVGRQKYTGSRVTPTDEAGTREWARAVIAGYHDGQSVTAWVDPASPDNAFLVRHRSFLPYLLIGLALLGYATLGGLLLLRLRRGRGMPES